jgi:hypothetical protein
MQMALELHFWQKMLKAGSFYQLNGIISKVQIDWPLGVSPFFAGFLGVSLYQHQNVSSIF